MPTKKRKKKPPPRKLNVPLTLLRLESRLANVEYRLDQRAPGDRIVTAIEHMANHQDIRGALLGLTDALDRNAALTRLLLNKLPENWNKL